MDRYFKNIFIKKGKSIDTRKMNRSISWMEDIIDKRKKICRSLENNLEEVSNCPICDCDLSKIFVKIHNYLYVECLNCGHIFLATPPNYESICNLYSGKGNNTTIQGEIYINDDIFMERVKQIALPKIAFCLENMKVDGTWLDCGCGTGELLMALSSFNINCKGIETDIQELDFAKNRCLNVEDKDVNSLKKEDFDKVNVVSFINILEHLRNPFLTISNISNNLDIGSYVVLEVPRHPSLSSYNSLAFPDLTYRHLYAPDHLHIFTECSVKLMLKNTGMEEIAVWKFGQDFKDFVYISSINNGLENNEFVSKIMDLFNSIIPDVQQHIDDNEFSDTMFIIAQKTM